MTTNLLKEELEKINGGLGSNLTPIHLVGSLPVHETKKYKTRPVSKIKNIVLHCTDRDWTVQQLAEYDVVGKLTYERKIDGATITDINHISKTGLPAITYHDVISDNAIYHTLSYTESSYHAAGYNSTSVAVAMLYRVTNPADNKDTFIPSERMVKLTQCKVAELCLMFGLTPDKIQGHRELKGTGWDIIRGRKRLLKTCPGMSVNLNSIRLNAAKYMQVKMKLAGIYNGAIDGIFGRHSITALELYKKE